MYQRWRAGMGGGGRGIIAVYMLRAATVTGVEMLSNSALWELFMITNSQPTVNQHQ